MEVILIRHTSVDVPTGVCYGQTDVPRNLPFKAKAAVQPETLRHYFPFDTATPSP